MGDAKPVVHLAMAAMTTRVTCGRWSKNRTMSAAAVTCPDCRRTWGFAAAERRADSQLEASDG
jgi:hypothetical protein